MTRDAKIVRNRIIERINGSKKEYFHYMGNKISKTEAIKTLNP